MKICVSLIIGMTVEENMDPYPPRMVDHYHGGRHSSPCFLKRDISVKIGCRNLAFGQISSTSANLYINTIRKRFCD